MATDTLRHIPVTELMERYRDAERFIALCRQCPEFNRQWSCPPVAPGIDRQLSRWHTATVIATRIDVPHATPVADAARIMEPERIRIEKKLLALEREHGGRAFTTVGRCLHCGNRPCTRPQGLPCRHPELVRPSLEAVGFNLSAILSDIFGIHLNWASDGFCPPVLTLVTALFHNQAAVSL